MPEEALKLVEKYPNVYQSFWSASDVIERSSDGFTVVSHIVVTPNQTQSNCPEVIIILIKCDFGTSVTIIRHE